MGRLAHRLAASCMALSPCLLLRGARTQPCFKLQALVPCIRPARATVRCPFGAPDGALPYRSPVVPPSNVWVP